ncbi:MAG TPA: NAD(P)-dependent alcohol dehydrogenase, partial [Rhizomicrobium sp.]|nr:NAD(P)-dependent alcohol dehydrogenase [Rhizomicrobium sp.]
CLKGEEMFCREGMTLTYSSPDSITGESTKGGYSKHLVTRQEFVLRMPDGLDLSRAAPLLCAGITTYSPLRTWNVGPESRVGVIGLGGLGHMAVKLAAGMGAKVTVLSRTTGKEADARALGADSYLISGDKAAMEKAANTFDLIIDTVPVRHDVMPYMPLLDIDGTLVIVGQLGPMEQLDSLPLLFGRRRISGSPIGGIAETQEMLDFCGRRGILPDCEMIRIEDINTAFERLEKADVRYRFVIDMGSLTA